jgi:hypothetical protein
MVSFGRIICVIVEGKDEPIVAYIENYVDDEINWESGQPKLGGILKVSSVITGNTFSVKVTRIPRKSDVIRGGPGDIGVAQYVEGIIQ